MQRICNIKYIITQNSRKMFVVGLIMTGKHSSAVIRNNPPTDVVTRVFIAFHEFWGTIKPPFKKRVSIV